MYLKAYSSMIHAVPGMHDWVQSGMEPIAPPLYRRLASRPKKLRRREADEVHSSSRVSRRNITMTSARCLKTSHNARSCKVPVHPNSRLCYSASQPMTTSQPASQPMPASQPIPPSQPMLASQPASQPMPAHKGRVGQSSSQPLPPSQLHSSASNTSGRGKLQAMMSTSKPRGRGRIGA